MNGRVVLVTGAGRGIGRAICRRFGREGAAVMAAARTKNELSETRRLVEEDGGECSIRAADVTATEHLRMLIELSEEKFGRIDVLVNNAGAATCEPVKDLTPVDFETMMRVNVAAVFYACQFAWPVMAANGGGTIVNISSMAATDPFPGLGTYGATKAWVEAFTRGLASEGKQVGIRAFGVAPGAVETQMLRAAFPEFPGSQALNPADVADVVYSVTQPSMAHASGQTLKVNR